MSYLRYNNVKVSKIRAILKIKISVKWGRGLIHISSLRSRDGVHFTLSKYV